MTPSPGGGSSSPAPPGSWGRHWSSGSCARVPDSRVVLLVRPGRRSTPMQRASREILKNDCFDRLRAGARRGVRRRRWRDRVTAVAGDVATDGLGLDDDGRRALSECDVVVHSAAAVSFDAPLDTAVEVNLLGPSRVAAAVAAARQQAAREGRSRTTALHPGLDRLRGRHPPGRGRRGAPRRQPLHDRRRLARRGRSRPAPARRHRGGVPPARASEPVHEGGPGRAGRGRPPPAGRAGRAAAARTGCGSRWSRSDRPGPSPSAGPTPIPTPRPSASGRWSPSSPTPSR